jgi:hypothetical protein
LKGIMENILEGTMKKSILLLVILALSFGTFSCGGGGAGSANNPPGENPGVPSVVKLEPAHFIAQTNSSITLHAKVLDGNGAPVKGVPVTFTNLSEPFGILSATVANTDNSGLATVTIKSTTPGFSTIMAQVNNGVGNVRDRKTVFFTSNDVLAVSMSLDVESVPPTSTPNEISDFTLFEFEFDNTVEVLATVRDAGGVPVANVSVDWSTDHTEAQFVRVDGTTNVFGQAKAIIKVEPESIRNTDTFVNVGAVAGNGAFNMITLFLNPVVINPAASLVTANPSIVNVNEESTITAVVFLNTGARAPDGILINFTTTCGFVTPFGTISGGVATATFVAPATPGTCTVTATSEGLTIGSVDILVIVPLQIIPTAISIDNDSEPATVDFLVIGGVAPYDIFVVSSIPGFTAPATLAASGTFTVTVPVIPGGDGIADDPAVPGVDVVGGQTGTVTITIIDQTKTTKTATITVVD